MSLAPGTRLGPYEIVSPIGAGGMGEVYRARDSRLGRDVAIKILHSTIAIDPDRLFRFEQEARAAAALNHPNILAVYDIGHDASTAGTPSPYIVSELLEGGTLRDQLADGPLPLRRAIDVAVQVARGLAAAHDKGIVHRDLKPENIFITHDGRAKILDFGLAKLMQIETPAGGMSMLPTTPPLTHGGSFRSGAAMAVRWQSADFRVQISRISNLPPSLASDPQRATARLAEAQSA